MPCIELITQIKAPIERCFDLSRSIDLHKVSTVHTQEEAISGKISGLIGLHETVEWRAKHLGIWQRLTTKITEYNRPFYFADEMVKGAFHSFKHEHHFKSVNAETEMIDIFNYKSPLGFAGRVADYIFLRRYMTTLLITRNRVIQDFAESEKWRLILNER